MAPQVSLQWVIPVACIGAALASVHLPAYCHPQPPYGHHPPSYKHSYCDPPPPPAGATNSMLSYSLEDAEYPEYDIKGTISADHIFAKKYADVADQSAADDLVETVTKEQEEAFNNSYYTGASTGDSPYDVTHWAGPEGYICSSDVTYARSRRACNVESKWRVIVNDVHYYKQTCLFPEAACRALAPCYKSHCTQKYVYHRLLSYDPCDPYKGLFIDIYKLPSTCSCHIPA
ncbi:hypothetical protein O3P69_000375 [Scylla paramamosain]|uniref:Spaetzle domain-containing protein n=1 Tax=Scylla paramamosain TaxID=85552 RepID=A0AAW0V0Z9_SCYPA